MRHATARLVVTSLAALLGAAGSSAQAAQIQLGILEDADPNVIAQIREQLPPAAAFSPGVSWSGSTPGAPFVVTWSLAPDGLMLPLEPGLHSAAASTLFAGMDSLFAAQGGRATWVLRIQQAFDRWEELSGVDFQRISAPGVDWDSGAPWGTAGDDVTLGDIRIASVALPSGVNSYTRGPQVGDIVLSSTFNFSSTTSSNRLLRNTVALMSGYASGLQPMCSSNSSQLMESFISTFFDGPQQDDVRAIQHLYGDQFEPNSDLASASALDLQLALEREFGVPPPTVNGDVVNWISTLSLRDASDQDWFRIHVPPTTLLDVRVQPFGADYLEAPTLPSGGCDTTNQFNVLATQQLNLELAVFDGSGALVASASSAPLGAAEALIDVPLAAGGEHFLRVTGAGALRAQAYRLFVRIDSNAPCVSVTSYCTPSTSSGGCTPQMSASGLPFASAASGFTLNCTQLEPGKSGLIFYGVNGPTSSVWAPGSTSTLCVKAPVQRTGTQQSGGSTPCSGAFSLDFLDYLATHPGALGQPFAPAAQVWAQTWYRDPPAPGTTNLSDGLTWIMCP